MVFQWKILSLFREVSGMSIAKINSFYFQICPYIIFLVKPVLILLKTTRSINISQKHITGQHITEKRAKTLKHWPNHIVAYISGLIFASTLITYILAYGLYYSESPVSLCKRFSPKWINALLPASLTDTKLQK